MRARRRRTCSRTRRASHSPSKTLHCSCATGGPYTEALKKVEDEIKSMGTKITALCGIKESDTGLALPAQWNVAQD